MLINNEVRDRLLGDASAFLVTIGCGMRVAGERTGSHQVSAIAICTQINGDLAKSQRNLIASRNYYGAAALGRQVLETTQMIWYLTKNPDRAEFWLKASDDDLRRAKDLRPSALRAATGSSGNVYSQHCLIGGHPRSIGKILLPGSRWRRNGCLIDLSPAGYDIQTDLRALLLADCLQHIFDGVLATIEAVDQVACEALGPLRCRAIDQTRKLLEELQAWGHSDPLASVEIPQTE